MAKYSELPDGGGTIAGGDQLASNQGGTSRRFTIAQLITFILASLGGLAALDAVDTDQIEDDAVTSAKVADNLALSGVPTAPTAAGGTSTTQIATTAFVQGAFDDISTGPIQSFDLYTQITGEETESDTFRDETASGAKWLVWTPGSNITVTYDEEHSEARVVATGNGSDRLGGIYQAVPSSEFTFVAAVAIDLNSYTNIHSAGIFVSEDVASAPTTADFACAKLDYTGINARALLSQTMTSYTAAGVSTHVNDPLETQGFYLFRGRMNGTTISWDFASPWASNAWMPLDTRTLGYTPTHFGIIVNVTQNTGTVTGVVRRVWVFDGISDWTDMPRLGKNVAMFDGDPPTP